MTTKHTEYQFKREMQYKYNNLYEYNNCDYMGLYTHMEFTCTKHNTKFTQTPKYFLNNPNCTICRSEHRIKTFIERANDIHNNKYDYTKTKYFGAHDPIQIYCKKCDANFNIKAHHHLRGQGCNICALNVKRLSKLDFIKKAHDVHRNSYAYDDIKYINYTTKIQIYCKKCGKLFDQTPGNHLSGKGCPKCAGVILKNVDDVITQFKKTHGNTYDYSSVEYTGTDNKIQIYCKKCKKHFSQTPYKHIHRKQGCPICKESKGEHSIRIWLEINNIKYTKQKRFNDCLDLRTLPFDFYINTYNLLIEFDGIQHFKPVNRFGGLKKFKITQSHDTIKTKYANNNNINLLRISYIDIDNISKILEAYFSNLVSS